MKENSLQPLHLIRQMVGDAVVEVEVVEALEEVADVVLKLNFYFLFIF